MKKSLITCMFVLLMLIIFTNSVSAKYVIEEKIEVATIQVDRTAPSLNVSYSTLELTSGNVDVTIKADEQIQKIEGWILQEDKKTIKKQFEKNIEEEIQIKDLSGNATKTTIKVNNIDTEQPIIEIQKVLNSNTSYPNYANKNTEISINLLIKDDTKIVKSLEEKDIKILVSNKEIVPNIKNITVQKDTNNEKQILVKILGIEEEGNLSIKISKDVVKDEIGNSNLELDKDLQIEIDNTNPQAIYSQKSLENGKVKAIITANEQIRKLDGWNLENKNVLNKVFNNNLSYTTEIKDLSGNITQVEIDIINATNIILTYASHNSMVGWSYGYGNYDIAGLEAINKNPIYKTESLALNISGDIEKDFLQAKAYVYTHWGEGSSAQCENTGKIYSYGWNPYGEIWKYENEETTIKLNGKNYFQLGGAGINGEYNTDINGNNMITPDITVQFRYGISALQLKLKSYNEYSICYQIYVHSVGWLKPEKNGEITCYDKTKPISAIRVALVPNTEVNALINTWNKDTGKIIN